MQSYEKSSAEQNEFIHFLCRDVVNYAKLRKIERSTKQIRSFFIAYAITSQVKQLIVR